MLPSGLLPQRLARLLPAAPEPEPEVGGDWCDLAGHAAAVDADSLEDSYITSPEADDVPIDFARCGVAFRRPHDGDGLIGSSAHAAGRARWAVAGDAPPPQPAAWTAPRREPRARSAGH